MNKPVKEQNIRVQSTKTYKFGKTNSVKVAGKICVVFDDGTVGWHYPRELIQA